MQKEETTAEFTLTYLNEHFPSHRVRALRGEIGHVVVYSFISVPGVLLVGNRLVSCLGAFEHSTNDREFHAHVSELASAVS